MNFCFKQTNKQIKKEPSTEVTEMTASLDFSTEAKMEGWPMKADIDIGGEHWLLARICAHLQIAS